MVCLATQGLSSGRLPICSPGIRSFLFKRYSSETGKGSSEDGTVADNTKESKPTDTPKNEVADRINLILKGMVEDNAKRGSESFKSKFPNENKGLKSRKEKLAAKGDILTKAAVAVGESLGDESKQIQKDLISKVADIQNPVNVNWSELISGMNVDHTPKPAEDQPMTSRAQQVQSALSRTRDRTEYRQQFTQKPARREPFEKRVHQIRAVDLFGGESLGIFTEGPTNQGTELKLWDYLKENELRIAVTHPPTNHFQRMILWTNQGKIWKFPIDNEQGLTTETDVHFSEHIFLETHLEGWCPRKGPVRHFMELVCVGLSKNPYMPIQEKRDHLAWFKEYFDGKRDLLEQCGAIPVEAAGKPKELSQ